MGACRAVSYTRATTCLLASQLDLLFNTRGGNSFVMTDLEQLGAPAFTDDSAQDTSLAAQEAQEWIEVRQQSLTSACGFIILTNRRL